jgi:hypothetical protein
MKVLKGVTDDAINNIFNYLDNIFNMKLFLRILELL